METRVLQSRRSRLSSHVQLGLLVYLRFIKTRSGNWDELKHYEYGQLTETEEFSAFKILFDGYLKNGDREKFYGKYYAQVPLKSTTFFRGLSRNAATLLAIKVADSMLAHCKRLKSSPDNSVLPSKTILSEKEKAGLQYLGWICITQSSQKVCKKVFK